MGFFKKFSWSTRGPEGLIHQNLVPPSSVVFGLPVAKPMPAAGCVPCRLSFHDAWGPVLYEFVYGVASWMGCPRPGARIPRNYCFCAAQVVWEVCAWDGQLIRGSNFTTP